MAGIEGVKDIIGVADVEGGKGVEGVEREALHVRTGAREAAEGVVGVARGSQGGGHPHCCRTLFPKLDWRH